MTSQLRDYETAIEVLQGAFEHYQQLYPAGPLGVPQNDLENPEGDPGDDSPSLQDFHILALADSLIAMEQYDRAINVIRTGARWLQRRRSEVQWDSMPDDREFDFEGIGRVDEDRILTGERMKPGSNPLDVNFRQRLARARIKSGDIKEGRVSRHKCKVIRFLLFPSSIVH